MIDPTSVVICAGASVVIALMLGFVMGRHRQGDPGAPWLTASNFAYLAAVASLLCRPILGFELSAFLVISFAYIGICLAYCAVLSLEEEPLPLRMLLAIGAVSLLAQGYFAGHVDSATPLMATSSIVNGCLTLWMTRKVWHLLYRRGGRIALLVALPFGAISFGYLSRLAAIMLDPGGVTPLVATILIITIMSWSAIILELGMMASVERLASARLTNALAQAQHIAKAKARERFLLSISHELRTPLNGVIGLSALMESQAVGPLPPRYASFAKGIHDSGVRLLDLVSNLLDVLAPHDAEQKRVLTDTSLPDVLSEVEQALLPLATSRNVALSRSIDGQTVSSDSTTKGVKLWVQADKRRLVQMLRHLGENAVKYANTQAEISVTRHAELDGVETFAITVSDDGPGLPMSEVENALELFGRARGIDDPNAGAGVGLTLAAAIARGHDTELSFEQGALGGLAVTVTLQQSAARQSGERPSTRKVAKPSLHSSSFQSSAPFCDALAD